MWEHQMYRAVALRNHQRSDQVFFGLNEFYDMLTKIIPIHQVNIVEGITCSSRIMMVEGWSLCDVNTFFFLSKDMIEEDDHIRLKDEHICM